MATSVKGWAGGKTLDARNMLMVLFGKVYRHKK